MNQNFRCGDPEALIGYLYDECDPGERNTIDAHVARCTSCAEELEALGATRTGLLAWTPPDARLGFQIVSAVRSEARGLSPEAVQKRPVRWWQMPMPAWAQAVAAVAVFGVGLSIGVTRGTLNRTLPRATDAVQASVAAAVSPSDLAALERSLRAEMTQLRTTSTTSTSASAPAAAGEGQVLTRVRALIQESEERQQRELALRTAELVRDFDTQRRVDLSRIERTFGQMEGNAGAEVAQQRQMLNYLMRVSEPGR